MEKTYRCYIALRSLSLGEERIEKGSVLLAALEPEAAYVRRGEREVRVETQKLAGAIRPLRLTRWETDPAHR